MINVSLIRENATAFSLTFCRFDFLIGKIEESETNITAPSQWQCNSCPPANILLPCGLTSFLAPLVEEIVWIKHLFISPSLLKRVNPGEYFGCIIFIYRNVEDTWLTGHCLSSLPCLVVERRSTFLSACPRTPYFKKDVDFLQLIPRKVRKVLESKENMKVFCEERVNELRSIWS